MWSDIMAKKNENDNKRVENKKKDTKKDNNVKSLYSLEELSDLLGVTVPQLRSMYLIRGLDLERKFTLDEIYKKLKL